MASFSCTDVESLLSRWNQETSTKFVDRCSSDTAVDIVNKLPWFEGIEELVWPEAYTPVGSPTTTTSTLSSSSSSSSSWYSGNSSSYMASSSSSSSSLDSHYRDVEYGDDTSLNSSFSFYVYNVIESGIPDSNDSNVIDASTTAESVIIAPTEEYSRSITSSSRCQSITSSSSRRGSDERQVSRLSWMHTTATVLRKQVSNSIIWRWCSTGVVRAARGAPGNFALKVRWSWHPACREVHRALALYCTFTVKVPIISRQPNPSHKHLQYINMYSACIVIWYMHTCTCTHVHVHVYMYMHYDIIAVLW